MRAICNVCQHKDTCSYLKHGRESDCIDVQTSDYGYDEAVEKAAKWLASELSSNCAYINVGFEEVSVSELLERFNKHMLYENNNDTDNR